MFGAYNGVFLAVTAASCVVFLVPSVLTCSCALSHPQDQACRAQFILRANFLLINGSDDMHPRRSFMKTFVILPKRQRIFKATKPAREALKAGVLVTPGHHSSCGVDFLPGVTYLVAGHLVNGLPSVNLCSWNEPWSTVTRRQKKGIAGLYSAGCQCRIGPCTHDCHEIDRRKVCSWNVTHDSCEASHSACVVGKHGRCEWLTGQLYNKCKGRDKQTKRKPSVAMALSQSP